MTNTDRSDLLQLVARFATGLPQTEDDNMLTFSPETVPVPPNAIETDQLVVTRGHHDYFGAWRIDYPQMFGPKPAYEALGIVTAAALLHPELDELTIRLTNPNSEIQELRIAFSHAKSSFGLHQVPVLFDYVPNQPKRIPWADESVPNPHHYPKVQLIKSDGDPINEGDWSRRDVLVGFGSAQGTARLVQLFLDMSRESNDTSEFALESEPGFRGVAPASAEIRFWLPGSPYFDESHFA